MLGPLPSLEDIKNLPNGQEFQNIIFRCWERDPDVRADIYDCIAAIEDLVSRL